MCFKAGGKSENGGISLVKLFDNRMMATLDSRLVSYSTIAFTKWVVPIVRHAILSVSILDCAITLRTAVSMPSVTFGLVVGVFCSARTPRVGVLENEGSIMTASLAKGQRCPWKSLDGWSHVFVPPTSTPIRSVFWAAMLPMLRNRYMSK